MGMDSPDGPVFPRYPITPNGEGSVRRRSGEEIGGKPRDDAARFKRDNGGVSHQQAERAVST